MVDRFITQPVTLESPACDAFTFTANSANVFSQPTRALFVGNGGTVTVKMAGKVTNPAGDIPSIVSFINITSGSILPIRCQVVYANSTANSFVGLF